MRVVGKTIIERRRNNRAKHLPVTLEVDGRTYETTEWTLGGFLLDSYEDSHRRGDVVTVLIRIDAGGGKLYEHNAQAVVARVDKERRQLAAKFIELEGGAIETLDGWFTGRLRRHARRKKTA
jgi:hypothetical protein